MLRVSHNSSASSSSGSCQLQAGAPHTLRQLPVLGQLRLRCELRSEPVGSLSRPSCTATLSLSKLASFHSCWRSPLSIAAAPRLLRPRCGCFLVSSPVELQLPCGATSKMTTGGCGDSSFPGRSTQSPLFTRAHHHPRILPQLQLSFRRARRRPHLRSRRCSTTKIVHHRSILRATSSVSIDAQPMACEQTFSLPSCSCG